MKITINKILKKLKTERSSIDTIKGFCVRDGFLYATNLDCFVKIPVDYEDGVYGADFEKMTNRSIEDFPFVKIEGTKSSITISKEKVKTLLKIASTEETRYYLKSVYVDSENLVSTNGNSLIEMKQINDIKDPVIISRNGLEVCLMLMKKQDDNLEIDIVYGDSVTWCVTKVGNIVVHWKTIDGNFPNHKSVFPKEEYNRFIELTKQELKYFKIKHDEDSIGKKDYPVYISDIKITKKSLGELIALNRDLTIEYEQDNSLIKVKQDDFYYLCMQTRK